MSTKPTYKQLQQQIETLSENEKKYRHLFETTLVGIFRLRIEDYKLLAANQALATMLGYETVDDFIEKAAVSDQYQNFPRRKELIDQLTATGSVDGFEIEIMHTDGSPIQIALSARTFSKDGFLEGTVVDITKSKQTEKKLQRTRALAETAFNQSPSGILIADAPDVNIRHANPASLEIRGSVEKQLTGIDVAQHAVRWQTFHPDGTPYAPEDLPLSKAILKGEVSKNVDVIIRNESGKNRWVSANASPITNPEGTIIAGIVIFHDITARVKAEKALQEREYRLRTITENTSSLVALMDAEGIYEFVNPAHKNLGYQPDDLIGTSGFDRLHPDDIPSLTALLEKALQGNISKISTEFRIFDKTGDIHFLEGTFNSKMDDKGVLRNIVFIGDDITNRKQTETALRESEEKYRTILDSIEDGYYEVDLAGNFTFFNRSMARILGYPESELMGMNNRQFMDAQNAEKVFQSFHRVFRTGEPYKSFDWKLICKDGSRCYIETSVSLRTNTENEPIGFQGIARDVTLRKNIEAERASLEEQLQRTKKMESLGTLAGGVAHDLNNVLSGIVSYPDLLLMDLPESSPLYDPIITIRNSGKKAAEIVGDLLALARRGVSTTEVMNLNTIILDYLRSPEYQKMLSYHPAVSVKTDLDNQLLNIRGSSIHLKKAIMNLVSNAAEAQPSGGEIIVSTRNRYVDTSRENPTGIREGNFIVLEVKDKGFGIAPEEIAMIFEPFYTKKVMGRSGTGLGMAVVWGTMQDHNGYIDVDSTEGVGTTFSLFFPVTREDIASERDSIPVDAYMGSGETLLVVDDVKEQREIAAGILAKLNYNVTTVSSGEAAVAYLENNEIDLLVLDMIMDPGIDGLETYKRIIRHHPRQKAIVASGYSETDRVREALTLGIGGYLRKPYMLEEIGLAIQKELKR